MAIDLTGTWRAVYSELDGEMTPVAHFSGIEITFRAIGFSALDELQITNEQSVKFL